MIALLSGSIGNASSQSIVSDRADYPPGTTATLTGFGFTPGEQVMIQVLHADGRIDTGEDHASWSVIADELGSFVTSWDVCTVENDCIGETFRATADGVSSGLHAETTFTDATAWSLTMAPTSANASQMQAYVLSALNTSAGAGNQMGCITISIPVSFTPVGTPSIVPGSTTHSWSVSRSGQVITATANSNGDRINEGESIKISMTATAPASPVGSPFTWTGVARTNTNCTGNSFGIPENGQPTVAVNSGCSAPGITCPGVISVNNSAGQCGAVVNFAATATGSPAPTITYSQNPGTTFPVGTTTVTATATNDCGSTSCSFTVTVVDNSPPTLALVGANPMTVECHDPFADPGATASDNCPGVSPVFVASSVNADEVGSYTVSYSVTDASGNPASAVRTVIVVDTTKPTVTLAGAESPTVECHTSFTDPGASASDLCAGSLAVNVSGSVDANTVGDYVLTYSASDPSGNSDSKTRTVHVVDTTNPVVTLNGADMTVECHGPAFSDPGATASDACAGSLTVDVTGSVNVNTVGDYVLSYSATDPSGNPDSKTRTVHVVDTTPPTIAAAGPNTTIQCPGVPAFTSPTASDACDAGVQVVELSDETVAGACPGSYVRTKQWKAVDASGNSSDMVSQVITVIDTTAPTIGAAGADATISCPTTPSFTAPAANDGCDSSPIVIEVSDVTTAGACASAYTRTKTWRARDCAGNLSGTVSQTITVVDVTPPSAAITGPVNGTVVSVGVPVEFKGVVGDGCSEPTAKWQIDLLQVPATVAAGGVVSTSYTFQNAGVYQVRLIATDACGNTTTASQTPDGFDWTVIVYDPAGGFVTGGGWILSPPGAYRPDIALTGKANFGFVSKYQKGAKVPTGETEFQFKEGDLNFHSTSYDWLVVAGAKAQYKGLGTINGAGGYGFLLTGIDGDQLANKQPDRFRVKIWNAGGVVYDNQFGQAEDSDASTALGGGSIVLQSGGGAGKNTVALNGLRSDLAGTSQAPLEFVLRGALPNPFAGTTEIGFDLPEPSAVTLVVCDVRGRRVATIAMGQYAPGTHRFPWNGRSDQGVQLRAGVYFARLMAHAVASERRIDTVRKMVLER